jgi:hypothetical protein
MPIGKIGVGGCITVFRTKVAVTVVGTVSVIEQSARVLEHPMAFPVPLLHPMKVEPLLPPSAWRTRGVPVGYWPAQPLKCVPPSVLHVTIPIPLPVVTIDSGTDTGVPGNRAVTVVSASIATAHGPIPEQPPPLKPVKPGPVAVSVITVFVGTAKEQVPTPALQLIPWGVDVTVPPLSITVSIFNDV